MFTTGETVGLSEWIIDDTCSVPLWFWYTQDALEKDNVRKPSMSC